MNTTMADGASERLDAQIADALFGQPGMSKMDVANQLRQLRGNGKPLLCGNCYGLGVIGYTSGQTPEQFEQGEYPCPDCAQPSPAGQGEALLREVSAQLESLDCGACIGSDAPMEDLHGRIAAHLAARQPMGQPVAWMTHHDEPMLFPTAAEAAAYCEDDEQPVPLFRSPAQGVDLAQFRECVELMEWQERGHANPDFPRGDAKKHAEALRLLALIDGHAGREPNSERNRLTAGIAASDTRQWEFRDALLWAEDSADCSSHPDHKAYRFAFSELLDMLGREEVGK